MVRNSAVLHGVASARSYKIREFRAALERLGVIGYIEAFTRLPNESSLDDDPQDGGRQDAPCRHQATGGKGKRYTVMVPDNADIRKKPHRLPFHVPDQANGKALEPPGKVRDLTREKWRTEGFTGTQSTTGLVHLSVKEGVLLHLLHQLSIARGNVLVVVPGRAPYCPRPKGKEHLRLECKVLQCDE